jgi:hypothetical protein
MDIDQLGKLAMTLLVIGLVIAISIGILATMRDTTKTTDTTTITGQTSTTLAGNTSYDTGHTDLQSVTSLRNATTGNLIAAVNYQVNLRTGMITITNGSLGGRANVTYVYYTQNDAYLANTRGMTSLTNFGTYLPTLAIVLITAVIVGLVYGMYKIS